MLQQPLFYINPLYYDSPVSNYYTDSSVYYDKCCGGFIEWNGGRISRIKIANINSSDINYGELVGIEMALNDISNNFNPTIRYVVNTDSQSSLLAISSDEDNRLEVENIRRILSNHPNIRLRKVKSHVDPIMQKKIQKTNGENITLTEARHICDGNKKIDEIVRGHAMNDSKVMNHNRVPFKIKV